MILLFFDVHVLLVIVHLISSILSLPSSEHLWCIKHTFKPIWFPDGYCWRYIELNIERCSANSSSVGGIVLSHVWKMGGWCLTRMVVEHSRCRVWRELRFLACVYTFLKSMVIKDAKNVIFVRSYPTPQYLSRYSQPRPPLWQSTSPLPQPRTHHHHVCCSIHPSFLYNCIVYFVLDKNHLPLDHVDVLSQ